MKPESSSSQTILWVVMLAIVAALAAGTLYLVTHANPAPASSSTTGSSGASGSTGSPGSHELPPGVTGTKDEADHEPSQDDSQARQLKGVQ